jgi:hypothetical protein
VILEEKTARARGAQGREIVPESLRSSRPRGFSRRRSRRIAILLATLAVSCSGGRHETAAPGSSSASASAPASAAPRGPSPRLTDARWIRARDEDPLERARLASAVGAAELLEGVEDGGETAETALGALPFADDAEIALGRLAALAAAEPARRRRVLEAILGVAGRPRRARELLDPEGVRRAGEALVAIAQDRAVPREERAIAISAARALAEKGYVDPVRIPTDLDPR